MEIIKVNMIMEDIDYGRALADRLVRNHSDLLVSIFEKQDRPVNGDITISDCRKKGHNLIILTEKLSQRNGEKHILYKYGNVRELVAHIIFAYSEFTGRKIISPIKEQVRVVSVLAANGGEGCTSISLAIAQQVKRFEGKKVLYISLEEFESVYNYFDINCSKKTIKEYLYYLNNGKSNLCSAIMEYIVADEYGIETFIPCVGKNPILELSDNDFLLFINSILETGRYQWIVIDGGNKLSDVNAMAYKISDSLCYIETPKSIKKKNYITYLKHMCGSQIEKNIIKVTNKFKTFDEELESDEKNCEMFIDYNPESFTYEGDLEKISVDKDFGMGIKQLTEKLSVN